MADFIHERRHLTRGDLVVVDCDHQCNVRLTDDRNFEEFRHGRRHQYYGGFYRTLPARIVVPSSGHWNVVIDLGGRRATAKYQISYKTAGAHAAA
jgi:hypothetical protein